MVPPIEATGPIPALRSDADMAILEIPPGEYPAVGIEAELPRSGYDAIYALKRHRDSAVSSEDVHAYHCGHYSHCDECDPHRTYGDWAPQEDCTVDLELVSRILRTDEDITEAIAALGHALSASRDYGDNVSPGGCDCGDWECEYAEESHSDEDAGCHVHVTDILTDEQSVEMYRTFYDFREVFRVLAQSHLGYVRGYNSLVHVDNVRSKYNMHGWLASKDHTFEFRLWNYSDAAWRVRYYAYVSRAMVIAASQDNFIQAEGDLQEQFNQLVEYLSPYMPEDIPALMERQFTNYI